MFLGTEIVTVTTGITAMTIHNVFQFNQWLYKNFVTNYMLQAIFNYYTMLKPINWYLNKK